MSTRNAALTAAIGVGLSTAFASAGIVWDEGVDGDLSNFNTAPTPVAMAVGANTIAGGMIGGDPDPLIGDGWDVFSINIGAGETLVSVILDNYVVSGGNTSSGFNVWQGPDAVTTFLGSTTMTVPGLGSDLLAASTGPLGPGTYSFDLREFGAPNQQYQLTFNIVPTPATAGLLGLGGLVCARRRR